jgi:hypothetical protein
MLENTQDPVHSVFLHTRISGAQFEASWGVLPNVQWVDTPLGMMNVNVRRWKNKVWIRTTELILPNINQSGANNETGEYEKYLQRNTACRWFRPIDNTTTEIIGWRIFNKDIDPEPRNAELFGKNKTPVFGQMDEGRSLAECQRQPGDYEAIVSQGPINVHARENLGATDTGVAKLRTLIRRGIRSIQNGKPSVSPSLEVNSPVPTYTQDTVIPLEVRNNDDKFIHEVGNKVARLVLESAENPSNRRKREFTCAVKSLSF